MKKYINKIKEWWKVPRYKALVKLGFYLIFIILIISMVNNAPKQEDIKDSNEETQKLYSYEFSYNITQNNIVTSFTGIHYNNTEKIINDLQIYYYKDNILYLNKAEIEDFSPFPLYKMRYDSIMKLANENPIDRTVYTDYEISTYQVLGYDFEFDHDFVLTIEKRNDYITKAIINIPEIDYKIEIEYKNFNSITSLEINI